MIAVSQGLSGIPARPLIQVIPKAVQLLSGMVSSLSSSLLGIPASLYLITGRPHKNTEEVKAKTQKSVSGDATTPLKYSLYVEQVGKSS